MIKVKNRVIKRLLPIYIASFFEGFILWYAVEKLFMTSIGFVPSTIALVVIVMGITGLLTEIPFGILADRWSRKGVLILSQVALIIAAITLGYSQTVIQFTCASVFYGLYIAMFSGTVDSIVYDTLLEENGNRNGYEKYFGYTGFLASSGLVLGSLAGGVVAAKYGLRATYVWTIPFIAVSMITLLFLREPKLHKQQTDTKIFKHISDTARLITQKGFIIWIVTSLVSAYVLLEIFYEMDQLWPIALHMPIHWYGPVNALLLVGYGVGGLLAPIILKKNYYIWFMCICALLTVSLLSVHNIFSAVASLSLGALLFETVYVIGQGKLHDATPSQYRSGVSSTVATFGKIAMLPIVYIFGAVAEDKSIFTASYLLIPVTGLMVIGLYVGMKKFQKLSFVVNKAS